MNELIEKIRQFRNDRDWDQYHSPKNLAMALMVEAAELAELFQWLTQEESHELVRTRREAIEDETGVPTFRRLRERALAYASTLVESRDVLNRPMAVYLPKSNDSVVAFAGILYSGNIYVPLDEKTPPAADNAGGGGGGTGRIRLNSVSAPSVAGTLSPVLTTGGTTLGAVPTSALP